MERRVLVIKDARRTRRQAATGWTHSERTFLHVISDDAVEAEINQHRYEVVVVAGGADRVALLSSLQADHPQTPFVLVTHDRDWREARDAMRAGAADILAEPLRRRDLLSSIGRLCCNDL